ncbi:ABC transporter ATP-binding protein [soil metagenome]
MPSTDEGAPADILELDDVEVVYDRAIVGLRGVSLRVPRGSIVALLGANGAGKTTTLRAITNLLVVHSGRVNRGSVTFDGHDITGVDPAAIVRRGISVVLEGRRIFAEMPVEENLRAGAHTRRDREEVRASYERVFSLFPVLADRRRSTAGYLSGGEQQMLAIGRALMQSPRLLLLDEPSLGLAPIVVEQICDIVVDVNRQGTSVVLVEQNATMALAVADHGYVLDGGAVVTEGPAAALRADTDIEELYRGVSATSSSSRDPVGRADKQRAGKQRAGKQRAGNQRAGKQRAR